MQKYGTKQYNLSIEIQYCSRGNEPKDKAKSLATKLEKKCLDSFPSAKVSFTFCGAKVLHEIAARPRLSTRVLKVKNGILSAPPGPSYICLVALEDYIDFITDNGTLDQNIFEFNVRDFEGKGNCLLYTSPSPRD